MTDKNTTRGMSYLGAIAIGVICCLVGRYNGKKEVQEDLASKVVGNHITIVDPELGRAELTDIDIDGDWDYLGITPISRLQGSYGMPKPRPSHIYMKPGFLARSPGFDIDVKIVGEETFNNYLMGRRIPMPGDSLLNEETRETEPSISNVFGSYSGLFNPEFGSEQE